MQSEKTSQASIGHDTRKTRTDFITTTKGDAVGVNWTVPKGDFARFLGFTPPTPEEQKNPASASGVRVLELAMMRDFHEVGLGAAKNGPAYSNFYSASDQFQNGLQRTQDTVREVNASLADSAEKNSVEKQGMAMGSAATQQYFAKMEEVQKGSHDDNMRYLEMQYKFNELGKQDTTLSNLMKTRHDSVSRTIRGGQ